MEEIFNYLRKNLLMVLMILAVIGAGTGYLMSHQKTSVTKSEPSTEVKQIPKTAKVNKPKSLQTLAVDIQGAVKQPGVYRIKNGAIVQEALQMAGGLQPSADVKQINQAKRVTDQMQLYVPSIGEKSAPTTSGSNSKSDKQPVNINTATVDDFKGVTGIGPKKAEKIIAFREKNGNFNELHDLTKVSGIGEKSLDSLKDQLTV